MTVAETIEDVSWLTKTDQKPAQTALCRTRHRANCFPLQTVEGMHAMNKEHCYYIDHADQRKDVTFSQLTPTHTQSVTMSQSPDMTSNIDELRDLDLSDGPDEEQDHQGSDEDSPQDESDPAQVSANTEGLIRVPTQDSLGESPQQTTAGDTSVDTTYHNAERDQLVLALRRPTPDIFQSPLLALQQQIKSCFLLGRRPTSREEWIKGLGSSLFFAACNSSTKVPRPPHDKLADAPTNWGEITTATVGAFACPANELLKAIAFQRLVTPKDIEQKPSASLETAYLEARAAARGGRASCSLIVVMLVDVYMQDLLKQRKKHDYTSFSVSLAIGIGPEGFIFWQSWVSPAGYGLGDWISKGGANIRTRDEATEFVHSFEKFVAYKVSGSACFAVLRQGSFTNDDSRGNGTPSATSCTRTASISTSPRYVAVRGRCRQSSLRWSHG